MSRINNLIQPRWRMALGIFSVAVFMTVIYDFGGHFGLPVIYRNYAGVLLFICIMLGAGVAYAGARLAGALPLQATKISLLLPLLWYLKEIWMAIKIYGVGAGMYAGLQGFYPYYFGLICVVMGVFHLCLELYQKTFIRGYKAMWRCSGYFFAPLLLLLGVEVLGWFVLGLDILFFQGFLKGYRLMFM
jgi:hypothetical protein